MLVINSFALVLAAMMENAQNIQAPAPIASSNSPPTDIGSGPIGAQSAVVPGADVVAALPPMAMGDVPAPVPIADSIPLPNIGDG